MRFAESVSGEKILVFLLCSYASFTMVTYIHLKHLMKAIPLQIPFKGLAVFGGLMTVFWIAAAKEICGRGYGVLTSVMTISMCLLVSPWFGIVDPPWFSIVGFASFAILGIATETIGGGFGNLLCMLTNWAAVYTLGIAKISIAGLISFSLISFASGYIGERLAKAFVRIIGRIS